MAGLAGAASVGLGGVAARLGGGVVTTVAARRSAVAGRLRLIRLVIAIAAVAALAVLLVLLLIATLAPLLSIALPDALLAVPLLPLVLLALGGALLPALAVGIAKVTPGVSCIRLLLTNRGSGGGGRLASGL